MGNLIVDYVIIILSLFFSVLLGNYFAKRQSSSYIYFTAKGRAPYWVVGLSILATLISSVTFIAYPGAGYLGNWILLVQAIMVVIVLSLIARIVVSLYRKAVKVSAYEYFERRFGYFARLYSSLAFAFTHFSKMGTVFFLISLVIAKLINLNPYITVWVLGFVVIYVTLKGGLEGILWLDAIQGTILILGGIFSIILIFIKLINIPGGIEAAIEVASNHRIIYFGPFDLDFSKLTFIVMVLNGLFYGLQKYGTDQTIVQRYLVANTDREAIKAALLGVYMCLPVWAMFMFIGSLLFVYYKLNPILPSGLKAEEVFIFFMLKEIPMGFRGLIISALVAAAISTLDSDLNSLSAVVVRDYYLRFKKEATEEESFRLARLVVIIAGVTSLLIASIYVASGSEGVLGIIFGLYAIFSGGIVGILILGLFSKRANKKGLNIGIIACIIFTAWATLTGTKIDGKLILDLGAYNFPHHVYMIGVYSHIVVIVVGYFASLLFRSEPVPEELTIYAWIGKLKKRSG